MNNKLIKFTFPDSGREIELQRVSPFALRSAYAHYDKQHQPQIPNKVIEQNINGEIDRVEIPNPNDPTYLSELETWVTKQPYAHTLINNYLYALRGLKSEPDHEAVEELLLDLPFIWEDAIAEYAQFDVDFDPKVKDAYVFLWHVCVSTNQDLVAFYDTIQNRQVTKEEL